MTTFHPRESRYGRREFLGRSTAGMLALSSLGPLLAASARGHNTRLSRGGAFPSTSAPTSNPAPSVRGGTGHMPEPPPRVALCYFLL